MKNDYSWHTLDNSRKNKKDIDGLKDGMSPNVYLNVGNEVEKGIQNGSHLSGWVPAKWSCYGPGSEVPGKVVCQISKSRSKRELTMYEAPNHLFHS